MIKELKEVCHITRFGQLFGIDEPPGYQCGNINYCRNLLQTIENDVKDLRTNSNTTSIDTVQSNLSSLHEKLENLREAIKALRLWGYEWRSLTKHLLESNPHDLINHVEPVFKNSIEDFLNSIK